MGTDQQKRKAYGQVFDSLIHASEDGFVVVNREGRITEFNDAYANFLALKREDVLGSAINEVIPSTEMLKVMEQDRIDVNSIQVLNTREITAESRKGLIMVTRSPIKDEEGVVVGAVAHVHFYRDMVRDLARLDELYSQLDYYNADFFQAAKERFQAEAQGELYLSTKDRQFVLLQYYQEEYRRGVEDESDMIIGRSEAFCQVKERALRVAKTSFSVLITGETGTGKEVLANLIHTSSDRARQPFIKINCAAIPFELLESELFGYEGGAFTGARREGKKGKFEIADKGSIFLDEIGDMPVNMQAKLLRVLQEGEIEPIGATTPVKVDVRVISATRRNLTEMVKCGEFREDLYFRLNEVSAHMPTLSERVEDIQPLAEHMLAQINKKYKSHVTLADGVLAALEQYRWPGNIRELNNVLKGAYSVVDNEQITLYNLPSHIAWEEEGQVGQDGVTLKGMVDGFEKKIVIRALLDSDFNYAKAAEQLGLHRSNLYKKIEKYGIDVKQLGQNGSSPRR